MGENKYHILIRIGEKHIGFTIHPRPYLPLIKDGFLHTIKFPVKLPPQSISQRPMQFDLKGIDMHRKVPTVLVLFIHF